MTDRLRVTLLGGIRITLDGAKLDDFRSKKSLALLSYLAVTGRPHSRERLGALLWGESGEGRARANLRTVLWDVRQNLPDFIRADRQTVSFDPHASHWIDVIEFSREIERVFGGEREDGRTRSKLVDDQVGALEAALSLYRGDFLAGFYISEAPNFESWVLRKREWARQLAIQGWHQLVAHYTAQSAYLSGIDAATQLLEIAPWQEETHRQLMRLLALNGQRGAALAQYEACREMLNDELGVEPTTETRLLYNRIKAGKALVSGSDASPSAHKVRVTPGSPGFLADGPAFIGRDHEMTTLKRLLSSPGSRLTSLVGATGIGKTRLAWEVADQMSEEFEHGAWFISLDGEEGLGESKVEEETVGPATSRRGVGSELHPELIAPITRAFGVAFTGGDSLGTQLTDYLSNKEALLVLDGIGGERLSVGVLGDLLRASSRVRLLLVSEGRLSIGSRRTLELDGLSVLTSEAERASPGVDLEDVPGDGAVALFLERARRVDPGFEPDRYSMRQIGRLCQLTAGVPLAIELVAPTVGLTPLSEAVRRLERQAAGGPGRRPQEPDGSRALRAACAYAWELLSPDHQVAVSKLALFEEPFTVEAAREIAGIHSSDLEKLTERAWVSSMERGRYLVHDGLRPFLRAKLKKLIWRSEAWEDSVEGADIRDRYGAYYLGLVASRGTMLVTSAAKAACDELEEEWRNIRAAWRQAVEDVRPRLLEESVQGVADLLLLKGWLWEGERLFDDTQSALCEHRHESTAPLLVPRLLMHRARLLNAQGSWSQVEEIAGAAARRLPERAELGATGRVLKAAVLIEWGKALYRQGKLTTATERLKQALSLVGDDQSVEVKARAFRHLGIISLKGERYDEALTYLKRALELYVSLDHSVGSSKVQNELGLVAIGLRQLATAETHLREALDLAQTTGDRRTESAVFNNLGRLASAQGDHDKAAIHCRKALNIARELGDRRSEAEALTELSLLLLHQGDAQQAWKRSILAVEIARSLGDVANEARAWLVAGHVFSELNMLTEATRACDLALELQRTLGQQNLATESLACLARVSLVRGDAAQALAFVEQILEQLESSTLPGANEPLRVYLTCYQVLNTAQDPRAGEVLNTVLSLYEHVDGEPTLSE